MGCYEFRSAGGSNDIIESRNPKRLDVVFEPLFQHLDGVLFEPLQSLELLL
jgi:hypothetical protein